MKDKMSITQIRLRSLIDKCKEEGISRVDIAHSPELDCDTSTITKHYNGDREVNSHYIVSYAKYFGVSADYLLGLSDVQTTNKDLSYICDTIGLEEATVQALVYCKKKSLSKKIDAIMKILIDKYDTIDRTINYLRDSNYDVQNKLKNHLNTLKTLLANLEKKDVIKRSNRKREKLYDELDKTYNIIMVEYLEINESITSLQIYENLLQSSIGSMVVEKIEKHTSRDMYFDARELANAADKEASRILNKTINAFLNLENLCKYSDESISSTSDPWRVNDGDY